LATSAGYEVVGRVEQIREPDPRYQIGRGKVEELAQLAKERDAQRIIFDNLLKPVQAYNLAKATGIESIDRFQLILEIFAKRATTTESKMQIRLAELGHELAHAKEKVRLARKEEQPGFMGLGAYKVEVYYRTVKKQVQFIRRRLRRIQKKRILHRKRRSDLGFWSISLAGYTNAGKSSLFNALTEESVPVDAALFTTLSTKTRLAGFSKKTFLLTDTVGFIDRLPLTLINAFHSTLEETIHSDLILLVLDISEPVQLAKRKLITCQETINLIGASGVPAITVLNKIDLLSEPELQSKIEAIEESTQRITPISALHRRNLDLLKGEILRMLGNYVQATVEIPLNDDSMSYISWLLNRVEVQRLDYRNGSAHMLFEAAPWFIEKARKNIEKDHSGRLEILGAPQKTE